MDAIGLAVAFRVEEHGWVSARALGVPVTATGRDRAEAELFLVDAVRTYFFDASTASGADPLDEHAELSLIPADPAWRPLHARTHLDTATPD